MNATGLMGGELLFNRIRTSRPIAADHDGPGDTVVRTTDHFTFAVGAVELKYEVSITSMMKLKCFSLMQKHFPCTL